MADVVDWDLAVSTGLRFAPDGPPASPEQAREAVAQMRELAAEAVLPVRASTGLVAEYRAHATEIVDRALWIRSNVDGFRIALGPLLDRLREKRSETPGAVTAVGSKVTALQLGGLLAWLSGKVLGQYEAFEVPGRPSRLLLVAPNIVHAERVLDVDPRDFRLWVSLHEETHRVQFGAVPWLSEHFRAEVATLLEASDMEVGDTLRRLLGALLGGLRGAGPGQPFSLIEAVQTPAQRAVFDRLTGLMSLLEGHADHVMDEVGPEVVPSVRVIRERFEKRRHSPGAVDGLARRLLGLDAKLRQYSDGAAFVRTVTDRVGRDGFNLVWTSPETLPSRAEIADPGAWVRRVVHGA